MIIPEFTGVTIQTPYGPFTVMTEMPIIPTPLGPIRIEKIKEEPKVVPVVKPEPAIGILPIAMIGLAIIVGTILLMGRK